MKLSCCTEESLALHGVGPSSLPAAQHAGGFHGRGVVQSGHADAVDPPGQTARLVLESDHASLDSSTDVDNLTTPSPSYT